jgi:hypothetical protein
MSLTTIAPVAPPRAARRAGLAVFVIFALNGFVFASWASRLPAIRDSLGITPGQLGLLLLVGSAGSLVALPLTSWFTASARCGPRAWGCCWRLLAC